MGNLGREGAFYLLLDVGFFMAYRPYGEETQYDGGNDDDTYEYDSQVSL